MTKGAYDRWKGEAFTPTEAALVDAALAQGVTKVTSCAFVDLIRRSEVPKGSAYRACPDGMAGVLDLLHRDTVKVIFSDALSSLAALSDSDPDAGFTDVVRAGINGVLTGLDSARWTGQVLWNDRDAVTAYLLRRGEGGIYAKLVGFATWCASNRKADPEAARKLAEVLVWEVLTTAVSALSPNPGEPPGWPATVGPELESLVKEFAEKLSLDGQRSPGPFFPGDLFLVDNPGQSMPLALQPA